MFAQTPGQGALDGRHRRIAGRPTLIAADSSTIIAYLDGQRGADIEALERALSSGRLTLPPVVVAELLSLFDAPESEAAQYLLAVPLLPILDGYWHRVGRLRATLRRHGRRSRLADASICQSCLDHDVVLIARDLDYRAHVEFFGLKLA